MEDESNTEKGDTYWGGNDHEGVQNNWNITQGRRVKGDQINGCGQILERQMARVGGILRRGTARADRKTRNDLDGGGD